ncbi:hypothetical protein [Mesorhizobium sp. SP-1A]|uniref:hypothetical protein n=1 Tax=Mesorhizobium sp. SP-1A TaxID=3077840 RepID=UPI0028F6E2C9|nr:hypothetical protein [Mesorhizobium sp. SP-1A]
MSDNKSQLRDESGALIGGLDVLEYNKGIEDFKQGVAPPDVTSTSYDLGRQRAAERAADRQSILDQIEKREQETRNRMREALTPEMFEAYEKKLAEIDAKYKK